MLAGSITVAGNGTTPESGASRNDGCKGIAMLKTHAGLW